MRLYANKDNSEFVATQADAKKKFGMVDPWDIPTDKAGLMEFLNDFQIQPTLQEAVEVVQSNAKPETVEEAIIRVRADKFDREHNTPTVSKGIKTKRVKRVVCYLEYDAAADEVVKVQMVSQMQLAKDDYPSWDKLDQQLSKDPDDT